LEKKAAAAFAVAAAAAAAYATKLAVDGVKAAIEDEQAQLRLASALRSATGATDAQIASTEQMIWTNIFSHRSCRLTVAPGQCRGWR
jgi:hypothetical protein